MKKYNLIIPILLLGSCSTFDTSRFAPGYLEAFESIKNLVYGYNDNFISPEIIEKIPYASLTMSIGKGPKGLMILESKKENKSTWVSADEVYILESSGKIVKTRGLNNNLDEILYTIDFSNLKEIDTNLVYDYYMSFSEPKLYNLKLQVKFEKKERELINLLNQEIFLTLIEEKIISSDLGWNVTNQYWIDDNSFIWKSVQTISPKVPKIFIEVTKKPSS